MGFVEDELSEVRRVCENVVPGCKLVSCVKTMFTVSYPSTPLLLELKSKTLSEKLLNGLTSVCEQEAKKYLGKAQVLNVIKFLRNFIDDNPLCCCYDEINILKKSLTEKDELKLKQKSSSVVLKVSNQNYYINCRIVVPDDYPKAPVDIVDITTNFSAAFDRHMICQAKEIARKCVEPPLRKKTNEPPFAPTPSLKKSAEFLIDCVKRLPSENCQFCHKLCFPLDPRHLEIDENSPKHVERVYCGHLFHQECFFTFMKTPPFGNKKCSACGSRIFHFKWSLSDRIAEERWAHEQARERELQEVTDFFK